MKTGGEDTLGQHNFLSVSDDFENPVAAQPVLSRLRWGGESRRYR